MKEAARYYDDFSRTYDRHRGGGYHAVLDELESEVVRRHHRGERVLEVGCGTGLVLERVRGFAPAAIGIDLSAGMLSVARRRGLPVLQARADRLPFGDGGFDTVFSFKVLPHVEPLAAALAEIHRVLKPGGTAILEFYNPRSLRGWWKRRRWWRVPVGRESHDREVYTAYHTPAEVRALLPAGLRRQAEYGLIVATPHPLAHRLPGVSPILRRLESHLAGGPLAVWGGFFVVVARREDG